MFLLQDIRYGLRMIVKAPSFTMLAVLALALGVCANTTIFSFINGLILRPLTGIKDPEQVVAVYTSDYKRVGSLPGVQSVSLSRIAPLGGGGQRRGTQFEGDQPKQNEDTETNTNVVRRCCAGVSGRGARGKLSARASRDEGRPARGA